MRRRISIYMLKLILVFLFIILIVYLRSSNAFRYPILFAEDGKIMFEYFTNRPEPFKIFRFQNSYVSLLPNIIGYVSTLFPANLNPFIMGGYSLFITSFSFCIFALKRFRFVVANDNTRIAVCCFLALLPLGNFAIHSCTTYSLWHLLWIYIMFSLAPIPTKLWERVFHFILLGLAAWSHPLSVICIPIFGVLLFLRKTIADVVMNFSQILILFLYLIFGIEKHQHGIQISFSTIGTTLNYLSKRVVFESLFGSGIRFHLSQGNQLLFMDVVVLVIIIVFGLLLLKIRKSLPSSGVWALLTFVIIIIGLTFLCINTRAISETSHMESWGHRYFYIQQILFLLVCSLIVVYSIQHLSRD